MKMEKFDDSLLKALYLAGAGTVVFQFLGLDGPVSFLFTLTFPLTVLFWLRSVRETLTGPDLLTLVTIALAAGNVLTDALLSGTAVTFGYLKKLIMFAMTLLFFQGASRVRPDRAVTGTLYALGDVLTASLWTAYLLGGEGMYEIGGRVSGYLTFGFTNPNLAAMVLCCLYLLQLGRLMAGGNGLRWVAALSLWYLTALTRSRNCLLVMALFTGAWLWLRLRKDGPAMFTRGWAAAVAVLPGLFVLLYAAGARWGWLEALDFLAGEGKALDSRMSVWGPGLEAAASSLLIGAYSAISGGTGGSQLHNTHLDIAASYGLPVLALTCALLGRHLHQKGRVYAGREDLIWIAAFGCGLLLGIGEAAVFSGGLGIYLFAGMFLLLGKEGTP